MEKNKPDLAKLLADQLIYDLSEYNSEKIEMGSPNEILERVKNNRMPDIKVLESAIDSLRLDKHLKDLLSCLNSIEPFYAYTSKQRINITYLLNHIIIHRKKLSFLIDNILQREDEKTRDLLLGELLNIGILINHVY